MSLMRTPWPALAGLPRKNALAAVLLAALIPAAALAKDAPAEPPPAKEAGTEEAAADSGRPLYRHAYENSNPVQYRVVVFFKGFLTKPEEKILSDLHKYEKKEAVKIVRSNLSKVEEAPPWTLSLWKKSNPAACPSIHLLFPESYEFQGEIWNGPLNKASVEKLASSSVAKEIVKSLKDDKAAAVWLFLKGGLDAKRDDELLESVKARLAKDSEERRAALVKNNQQHLPPMEKSLFTLISLSRTDPEEQPLIQQVLKLSPKALYSEDTVAIPVYGRGRTLGALVGPEIAEKNIKDYNYLLTSTAKEGAPLPPGQELFMPEFLDDPAKGGGKNASQKGGPGGPGGGGSQKQSAVEKIFKTFDNEGREKQFSILILSLFLAGVMLVFIIYADRLQRKK